MMYDELVKRLREAPNDWPDADLHYEAADAIEELQKIIEQYKLYLQDSIKDLKKAHTKEPKWIPVTERPPEPKFAREWYLVALESGCIKTLAFEKQGRSDNLFRPGWHETASPVTHWMPLPKPPKEKT